MYETKREEILNIKKDTLGEKYEFVTEPNGTCKPIGQGGSGIVYIANQIFSSNKSAYSKRAIKFFAYKDELVSKLGFVSNENFDVEINNICRFNHQNILKVIDGNYHNVTVENDDGTKTIEHIPYTVTEFIDGPTLEDLFQTKNKDLCQRIIKDEDSVFELFYQILVGIEYLHKNNFFHCDIAPKNIFIKSTDNDFLAVIGDLGAGKTTTTHAFQKTRVIGTRAYMPDNVKEVKDEEISYEDFCALQPAWDIYSTIITLKEIIITIKESEDFCFDFWNIDRLYEKLGEYSYKSIGEIIIDIEHLRPTSNQIFRLDELSEASKSVGQVLLPINSAYLSRRMRELSKHDMVLRLMDVPQLLEGATTFPGANHTRYEHTLGTYELMRKAMLSLLRNKEYAKFLSEKYVIIGLLAALLSSITNFPYSYAINELQNQENELFATITPQSLFDKLIGIKSDIIGNSLSECISELFDEYKIDSSDIKYVIFGKEKDGTRNKELDVLNCILNSSVGVRVIDYMMRDSHHIGLTYKIDTDALFKSMSIWKGEFCLRQPGITSAEQIISNRYWLFKRIYWSDPNRANCALLKHIFYTVHSNKFSNMLYENFHLSSEKDIQNIVLENCCEENKSSMQCSINQINKKGQTRYKSILVLDKNSEYPHSNDICNRFSNMTYSKQHEIRDKIECELMKKYKISEIYLNHGAILLIDMPHEKQGNKLGDDIRILRYDKSCLSLDTASGIVSGLKTSFDNQLMLLRVFVRPDVFEKLIKDYGRSSVENFICEKLYEFL